MSNALAIATVTATLGDVLLAALSPTSTAPGPAGRIGSNITVTHLSPDVAQPKDTAGVNVFLYQVSPSAAWRNADLPTRRADGTPLRRPQLALDLHYLLTFFGDAAELEPQRLLGAVARQMHAQPTLTRDQITSTVNYYAFLNTPLKSNLADQIELVRFTPVNFTLEEMSKLWSVFLKTDYALSVAYVASVVLIETDDPVPGAAPPVLQPNIIAVPFSATVIEAVEPPSVDVSLVPPTRITLIGRHLDSGDDVVLITPGRTDPLSGSVESGNPSRLVVRLPADLRAGVNTIRLIHPAPAPVFPSLGPQGAANAASESNVVAFVLQPAIRNIMFNLTTRQITITVAPVVGLAQTVSLVLNQFQSAPSPALLKAFTVPANSRTADTDSLVFETGTAAGSIPVGVYLAQVRVDGIASGLAKDSQGQFIHPHTISITA